MKTYHTLEDDGDDFEKLYWNIFIREKFPYYEVYWQNCIVPLTERPKSIHIKTNSQLKKIGKSEHDVKLAQLHYTILRGLISVYNIKVKRDLNMDDFIEGFIRFSNTLDSIYEFLERICNPNNYDPWRERDSLNARKNWRQNNPVFNDFYNYRNHLVHSTLFPNLFNKYPKIGKESKYLDWRKITRRKKISKNLMSHFEEYNIILDKVWNKIIKYANREWGINFRNLRISRNELKRFKMLDTQISTSSPAFSGSRPILASDQSDEIIHINNDDEV